MRAKNLLNLMGDKLHTLPLIVLYLTDGCNSRCVTCDIWRNPRRNMPMPMIETIASECEALGVRWILLSGGEAMQHPEWPAIGRRFREAGVHVMLLTNGLLLRKQADDLPGSVDEVIVSLDGGTAATYDAIRGVDAFDLVLDGMRAVKAHNLPLTTRTTVQRANYREIPQIIDAGLNTGADLISFLAVDVANPFAFGDRYMDSDRYQHDGAIPLHDAGASLDPSALTPDDLPVLEQIMDDIETRYADAFAAGRIAESPAKLRRTLVDYFRTVAGDESAGFQPPRCNAPHFSTVIEVDGRLRPCYFLPEYGKLKPGDRLAESINGDVARDLRRAYRTGQRAECQRCVCPLYKGPRSLLQM